MTKKQKPSRKRISEEQKEQAWKWYFDNKISTEEIGKRLGFSGVAIRNFIKLRGGKIRDARECHMICEINEKVLDTVTDEMAYWTGFFLADGYITGGGNETDCLGVTLCKADKNQLEKLKEFFGSTHPIREKKTNGVTYCVWTARSQYLANRFKKYGVTKRKSKTATPGPQVKENPHFWRGVIDGDGAIEQGNSCPVVSLIGSYPTIEAFCSWFQKIVPNYPVKSCAHRNTTCTAGVRLHGEGAMKLLETLYKGAIVSLDRKQKIAEELMEKWKGKKFRVIPSIRSNFNLPLTYKILEKAHASFDSLLHYDSSQDIKPLLKHDMKEIICHSITKRKIGYYASHYFHEKDRLSVNIRGEPSPVEVWKTKRDRIIKEAENRKHSSLHASFLAHSRVVWGFPPAVAKAIYTFFDAKTILDPCAGWGDRLVAALATKKVAYHGIDPSSITKPIYERIRNAYQNKKEGEGVVEKVAIEDATLPDNYYDLAFTSPPYFDWEHYSKDQEQSYLRYQTPEEWKKGFLRRLVEQCQSSLKKAGVMAINISNVPKNKTKNIPLIEWLFDEADRVGLRAIGTFQMETGNFDRKCEGIFCWKKR